MTYRSQKAAIRTLTRLAAVQGGYFTAKQAEESGFSNPHLTYHLKAKNFERAGHGLYRIPTQPLSEHDDLVRLSLWSRDRDDHPQAVVSHQTALSLHGLGELIPGEIHLIVPRSFRKRFPKGVQLHKGEIAPSESKEMMGFWITTPVRTLEDLVGDHSISREQFERAVVDAADQGLIRQSQKKSLLEQRGQVEGKAAK